MGTVDPPYVIVLIAEIVSATARSVLRHSFAVCETGAMSSAAREIPACADARTAK